MNHWKRAAAFAVSMLALSGIAHAQQTGQLPAPAAAPEGVQVFDPAEVYKK